MYASVWWIQPHSQFCLQLRERKAWVCLLDDCCTWSDWVVYPVGKWCRLQMNENLNEMFDFCYVQSVKGSKVYALAVCVLSSVSKAEWYWSNMWYLASFHRVVWNVKVTILFSNESTIGYKPLYSAMLSVKWELRLTLTKDFCHLKGKREQKKQSCQFN